MITKADIKLIVSLQLKKQRQKYGQFVVEGEKSIAELLTSPFKIDTLYGTSAWLSATKLDLKPMACVEITEKELQQLSVHQTPQGALAVVNIPKWELSAADFQHDFAIALDDLQDPGNLGTIIRIADWYGIKTIVCGLTCTDVFNPKCINSTMGSFTRVKVVYEDILEVSQKFNQPIIAATLNGDNIHQLKTQPKGLILIGNEGHGIGDELLSAAKFQITIPRIGHAESLNAAVSAAIIIDNLIR